MLIESKKRKRDITVTVARHGSEPLSRRLLEHIKQEAATESKILQLDRTSQFTDLDGLQAGCAEDASKWNTLLLAARADRGPQWDNGTQLWQVDKGSKLYYDSSALYRLPTPPPAPKVEAPPTEVSQAAPPPDALAAAPPGIQHPQQPGMPPQQHLQPQQPAIPAGVDPQQYQAYLQHQQQQQIMQRQREMMIHQQQQQQQAQHAQQQAHAAQQAAQHAQQQQHAQAYGQPGAGHPSQQQQMYIQHQQQQQQQQQHHQQHPGQAGGQPDYTMLRQQAQQQQEYLLRQQAMAAQQQQQHAGGGMHDGGGGTMNPAAMGGAGTINPAAMMQGHGGTPQGMDPQLAAQYYAQRSMSSGGYPGPYGT